MTDFEQGPSERAPISSADIEGIDQTAEGLGLDPATIFKRAMGKAPFVLMPHRDDEWRRYAACTEVDPEIFEGMTRENVQKAKEICAPCDAREECLDFALKTKQPGMVWGGLTEDERQQVVRGERSRGDLSIAEEQFENMLPPPPATSE